MNDSVPGWLADAEDPTALDRALKAGEAEAAAEEEAGGARLGAYGHRAMMNPRATPPRKGKPRPEGTPPTPPGGEGEPSGEDDNNGK